MQLSLTGSTCFSAKYTKRHLAAELRLDPLVSFQKSVPMLMVNHPVHHCTVCSEHELLDFQTAGIKTNKNATKKCHDKER